MCQEFWFYFAELVGFSLGFPPQLTQRSWKFVLLILSILHGEVVLFHVSGAVTGFHVFILNDLPH